MFRDNKTNIMDGGWENLVINHHQYTLAIWTHRLKVLLLNRIEGGKLWFLLIHQNTSSTNNDKQ